MATRAELRESKLNTLRDLIGESRIIDRNRAWLRDVGQSTIDQLRQLVTEFRQDWPERPPSKVMERWVSQRMYFRQVDERQRQKHILGGLYRRRQSRDALQRIQKQYQATKDQQEPDPWGV